MTLRSRSQFEFSYKRQNICLKVNIAISLRPFDEFHLYLAYGRYRLKFLQRNSGLNLEVKVTNLEFYIKVKLFALKSTAVLSRPFD